jgi:hypothetical protein
VTPVRIRRRTPRCSSKRPQDRRIKGGVLGFQDA